MFANFDDILSTYIEVVVKNMLAYFFRDAVYITDLR